ncbi:MAG: Xaa-Pro peptidase family protein [Candidatus Caldarchaeum sp.]
MRQAVFDERIDRLAERLRASSVDATLLCSPSNVFYFTGYRGGVMVASADGSVSLFSTMPVSTPVAGRIEVVEKLGRRDAVTMALEYLGNRRISLGYDTLSVETYLNIVKTAPLTSLTPVKDMVYELRQVKSQDELEVLRKACFYASTAVEVAREIISYGTTVADIRRAIADNVYRLGAELAFNPRVSFGEDTFLNMDSPSERSVKQGELVKMAVGVVVEGYVATLSRTYFYGGKPSEKLVKSYTSLLRLKEMVMTLASPWTSAVSIYDKCRAFAIESGLDPATLTSFGRGIGLEDEEPPLINANSADIIREGTVVSIGPDLLLPGRYGISVTDVYRVSADGVELLTDASLELELS